MPCLRLQSALISEGLCTGFLKVCPTLKCAYLYSLRCAKLTQASALNCQFGNCRSSFPPGLP